MLAGASQHEVSEVNGVPAERAYDVRVTEFICHDESFVQSLASDERQASWRLQVRGLIHPIIIKLHADSKRVSLKVDGHQVLPVEESLHKNVLSEDFKYEWPVILGAHRGLHENGAFEVQPGQGCHGLPAGFGCEADPWYPATLMTVREDGDFDAIASVRSIDARDTTGEREVVFPGLSNAQIRVKGDLLPPQRRHHSLVMTIPKHDPRCLGLLFDDVPITQLFARETPPGCYHHRDHGHHHHHHRAELTHAGHSHEALLPRIRLVVNKLRTGVTSNVGHTYLGQFLACEPRSVFQKNGRLEKIWKLQIGPFAEHTIVLEKRFVSTDIVTLSVDDEYLVEATQKDLDCHSAMASSANTKGAAKHIEISGAIGEHAYRTNGKYVLKGQNDGYPAWQNRDAADTWLLRFRKTGKWIVTSGQNKKARNPTGFLTADDDRELPTDVTSWNDSCASVKEDNPPHWQCDFCFVNERIIEYEVFEEYRTGETLETKGIVSKRLRSTIHCSVILPQELGLANASLKVNDKYFEELRFWHDKHQEFKEHGLQTTPETLKLQYDLTVPHRVSEDASKGSLARWANGALAPLGLESLFENCQEWCKHPAIPTEWCANLRAVDFRSMVAPAIAAASSMCSVEAEEGGGEQHLQNDQKKSKGKQDQHNHDKDTKDRGDSGKIGKLDLDSLKLDNSVGLKFDNNADRSDEKSVTSALSSNKKNNKKKTARPKLQFS